MANSNGAPSTGQRAGALPAGQHRQPRTLSAFGEREPVVWQERVATWGPAPAASPPGPTRSISAARQSLMGPRRAHLPSRGGKQQLQPRPPPLEGLKGWRPRPVHPLGRRLGVWLVSRWPRRPPRSPERTLSPSSGYSSQSVPLPSPEGP